MLLPCSAGVRLPVNSKAAASGPPVRVQERMSVAGAGGGGGGQTGICVPPPFGSASLAGLIVAVRAEDAQAKLWLTEAPGASEEKPKLVPSESVTTNAPELALP